MDKHLKIKGEREREREYQSQRKGKGRENKCEKTKVQKNRIVIPQRKIITGKVKQARGQLCKVERNVNICHYISARTRTAMTRLEIRNETPQLAWNTNKNQKQNLAISFNIPLVILSHFSSFCNSSDPLFRRIPNSLALRSFSLPPNAFCRRCCTVRVRFTRVVPPACASRSRRPHT